MQLSKAMIRRHQQLAVFYGRLAHQVRSRGDHTFAEYTDALARQARAVAEFNQTRRLR